MDDLETNAQVSEINQTSENEDMGDPADLDLSAAIHDEGMADFVRHHNLASEIELQDYETNYQIDADKHVNESGGFWGSIASFFMDAGSAIGGWFSGFFKFPGAILRWIIVIGLIFLIVWIIKMMRNR